LAEYIIKGEFIVINTTGKLINEDEIKELLLEIVKTAHDQLRGQAMLLNVNRDIDLLVATEGQDTLIDLIKENFLLDEDGDIIDEEKYRLLLDDLQMEFVKMYKTTGLFDFFPAGEYEINGEERYQQFETIATKGMYFAPFEDCLIVVH
jgi:hypothetical protein